MDVVTIIRALERAQAHAYPGREAVERDAVLRQLWRELQRLEGQLYFQTIPRSGGRRLS